MTFVCSHVSQVGKVFVVSPADMTTKESELLNCSLRLTAGLSYCILTCYAFVSWITGPHFWTNFWREL